MLQQFGKIILFREHVIIDSTKLTFICWFWMVIGQYMRLWYFDYKCRSCHKFK